MSMLNIFLLKIYRKLESWLDNSGMISLGNFIKHTSIINFCVLCFVLNRKAKRYVDVTYVEKLKKCFILAVF